MSFWGAKLQPGKSYTHIHCPRRRRLRLTQATIGCEISNADMGKKNVVQLHCTVKNKEPVLVCALVPGQLESCRLELELEDKYVTFSVVGPRSVHIVGYFVGHLYKEEAGANSTGGDSLEGSDSDSSWATCDDNDNADPEAIIPVSGGQVTTVITDKVEDCSVPILESKSADCGSKKDRDLSNDKSSEDRKRKRPAVSYQFDSSGEIKANNDWVSKKKIKAQRLGHRHQRHAH